jgi:membrane protease YdiL (CAAX protease family)
MSGHEPRSRAPSEPVGASERSDAAGGIRLAARGTGAAGQGSAGRDPPWLGGRVALIVAGLGLLGAAVGALWFGVDARLGLSSGGLSGAGLVLLATALLVGGVALMIGGLGYYVLAPAFLGPAMAWRGVGSHRLVLATTALVVLVANAGPLVYTGLAGARGLCSVPGFLSAALSVDAALLGITYLRFIRPGVLRADDLGLDRARLTYHVGVGMLVGVGVLIVSGVVQTALQAVGVRQTQLLDLQCVRQFPLPGFLAVLAAGGVLAPIAEELYFRGFVFRTYLQVRGPLVAYGATSALFATLHLNLPALLPILVLSLILCLAYQRTGSIIPSIVGHALNNSAAFCILYFTNSPP